MTENHPLTEEQIAEHWDENCKSLNSPWDLWSARAKQDSAALARAAYDQGVKDTQERTGWTDEQLHNALSEASYKEGGVYIAGGSESAWLPSELADLRVILTALGIHHEPPATHPNPEAHPLIIDNTDGSAWRYDGGKYRAPAFGFTVPVTWRNPETFTDWSPARVAKADHE